MTEQEEDHKVQADVASSVLCLINDGGSEHMFPITCTDN